MPTIHHSSAHRISLSNAAIEQVHGKKRTGHSILKKIGKKALHVLSFGKLYPSPALKKEQIRAIKQFNHRKLYTFPKTKPEVKDLPAAEIIKAHPKESKETLEGMRDFAREMISLTIDCVQKKHLDPQLKEFNKIATTIPQKLRDIAKQAISIGTFSAKPIFEFIYKFQFNDQAMEKIDKALKWAYKDIKPEEPGKLNVFIEGFKDELLRKVEPPAPAAEQQNGKQQLDDCTNKILHWLFKSDHTQSPHDLFKEEDQVSEELITSILETSLLILAERKIDLYEHKANKFIQNNLSSIIETKIRKNAVTVTDLLSARLAEVIQTLDNGQFTVLFDKMIELMGKHVSDITKSHEASEKATREHQALKEHALKIVKGVPKNANEEVVFKKCENYLNSLAKKGGIAAIEEDVLFSTFLTLNASAPSTDNTMIAEISKLIIDTLLPSTEKDGKNGLENLLTKIELPEQFDELVNEAKEIAQMIVSKEQFKELNDLGKAAGAFKDLAFEGCAEVIKMGLNEAIGIVVKQMSKPEELNLLLTKSTLPIAMDSMIKFFADDIIQAHIPQLAPLFQKLPNEDEEKKLIKILFEKARKEASQFKFENEEAFYKIVKPRIEEIVELLALIKKPDLKSTIAIIKEYYKYDPKFKDNNPHFADFIDASLKTGEFGTLFPRMFNLKVSRNMVSKAMTASIQNYRKSYIPNLNIAIPMLKEKYAKPEVIDKMVEYRPSLESLEEDIVDLQIKIDDLKERIKENNDAVALREELVKLETKLDAKINTKNKVIIENRNHENELADAKINLPTQVHRVAQLGYDMLMFKAKRAVPFVGQYLLKKILGPTADKISRVALTLINRIMGHQAFNEHLIGKIFLTSLKGLHMSAMATRGDRPLLDPVHQIELNVKTSVNVESLKAKPFKVAIQQPLKGKPPIWKRILNYVLEKFLAFINIFKTQRMTLDNRELYLMTQMGPNQKILDKDALPLVPDVIRDAKIDPVKKIQEKQEPVFFKEQNPDLNSSLLKVGEFVSVFMKKIGDEVYKEKIESNIKDIAANADRLPEKAHQMLDWISRIITPLTTTLFSKITKKGYKVKLDESSCGFFYILFKDMKKDDLDKLQENLEKVNTGLSKDELNKYIAPMKAWIAGNYKSKEEIKPLSEFTEKHKMLIENFEYRYESMNKLYVSTIQWLVKHKIESRMDGFQKFLENDLGRLIQTHLNKNIQHLSKLLFNRTAGLINNVNDKEYKQFFDLCANDFNQQMINLIKAEENVFKEPMTDEQKKNPAYIHEKIAKELASEKIDPRTKQRIYVLHPLAKALLQSPADVKNAKELEENKVFLKLVERMMNLALPTGQEQIDGQARTADAFLELWDNIIIEPEVTLAIDEFRDFIKILLPEKYADKLDIVESKVKTLTKEFILNTIKRHATTVLAEKLRETCKLISDSIKRREFIANQFPVIHKQLVKSFAYSIMKETKGEKEKLFKLLIEGEENPAAKDQFIDKLLKLCADKFSHSWANLKINRETFKQDYLPDLQKGLMHIILKDFMISNDFKKNYQDLRDLVRTPNDKAAFARISGSLMTEVIKKYGEWNKNIFKDDKKGSKNEKENRCFNAHLEPLIKSIVNELTERQNAFQRIDLDAKLKDDDITTILKHFLEGENDNNMQFVDIITHTIKMGNFGGAFNKIVLGIIKMEKENLNKVIVPAMHPIRASIRNVTDLTVEALKANYLNDNYIKNLVNPQSLEILKAQEEKLQKEIQKRENVKKDCKDNDKIVEHNKALAALAEKKVKIQEKIVAAQIELDNEPERQANIERKFDDGLQLTTRMLYDLIEYSHPAAKAGMKVATDPKRFLEDSKSFYNKFFDNEDLNEALVVNVLEKSLDLVEAKNGG